MVIFVLHGYQTFPNQAKNQTILILITGIDCDNTNGDKNDKKISLLIVDLLF